MHYPGSIKPAPVRPSHGHGNTLPRRAHRCHVSCDLAVSPSTSPPAPAMAVTKLNADALPYHSKSHHHHQPPPPHHVTAAYHFHPAAGSLPFAVVGNCPYVPFLVPAYNLPPPHPPVPFSGKAGGPLPPPPAAPVAPSSCKAAPSPLPHGSAPHELIVAGGVEAEKQQAQAAAKARASAAVKPGQEPAPAPAPHPRRRGGTRVRQQDAGREGRSKELRPRKAEPVARARPPARSPSPAITTRPPAPVPAPEWLDRPVTTVMIRNIPNKLTPWQMMELLDDHCARANRKKKRGTVVSAYDFLYLRMDFRVCSNMGYAFVNLTTAEAARRLHWSLHGSRWKVFGSKKVIDIRAARIQGKEALVRHFSGSTFACHTDGFLPAVFSPPRDGATGGDDPSVPTSKPMHVGRRVPPPAPRPQQLTWRPVCTEVAS